MSSDMTVCVWDEDTMSWVDEGITDYQYSESTRIVQFYMTCVGAIALVKNRTADFPYKKWSLSAWRDGAANSGTSFAFRDTPSGVVAGSSGGKSDEFYEREARLVIQTQSVELTIGICGSQCFLAKAANKPLLDLLNVKMSPGQLLYTLQKRGVNLIPTQTDLDFSPHIEATAKVTFLFLENIFSLLIFAVVIRLRLWSSVFLMKSHDRQTAWISRAQHGINSLDAVKLDCSCESQLLSHPQKKNLNLSAFLQSLMRNQSPCVWHLNLHQYRLWIVKA